MKQCCLCGKTGHESSECRWRQEVAVSGIGHAMFTVKDEVGHAISGSREADIIIHRAVSAAFELEFGKCQSKQS